MKAPEIEGVFEVAITDRSNNKTILTSIYNNLNDALKATRTWTTSITLRRKWFRVTITDQSDTTRELEQFNLEAA